MPLTSQRGLLPTSPVEEDLQKLFDEVLAGFAEEETSQSPERDLENIYNGYTDDSTNHSSHLAPPSQPSMFHCIVDFLLKLIVYSPSQS